MARNRRSNRKPDTDARKPPARFVRRRRAPRRERAAGDAPSHPAAAEYDSSDGGSALEGLPRAWSRAPRPAEPPPRNPAVFSYTHTITKTS
jgi:hypothetical protein